MYNEQLVLSWGEPGDRITSCMFSNTYCLCWPTCLCSRWRISVEGNSIVLSIKEKRLVNYFTLKYLNKTPLLECPGPL